MPCLMENCTAWDEINRFLSCLTAVYLYQYLWDRIMIRPIVHGLVKNNYLPKAKFEQCRESIWKNVAVGTLFSLGLYLTYNESWFFSTSGYWSDWPWKTPVSIRWYYMLYASYWIQSIDFLCSFTCKYYNVRRKDHTEMLIHHIATLALMGFSYLMDFTKIGACILMLHDVNDLLLETAKIFNYMESRFISDLSFAVFAIVWYYLRWYSFATNFIYSVYSHAYDTIVRDIYANGGLQGWSPFTYHCIWLFFLGFLCVLLILHLYWGYLIGIMVIRALGEGKVGKDVRSDSENEDNDDDDEEEDKQKDLSSTSTTKRRRAPKAD